MAMSVYTKLSASDIERVLQGYALGKLQSYSGIADGIENTNYFVHTDQGRFVLTLFERMNVSELPYFLELMHFLAERDVPCPDVMVRDDGSMLFSVHGKKGCIVSCLPGRTHEHLNREQLRDSGRAQAKLHLAGRAFPLRRPNPTDMDWMRLTVEGMWREIAHHYGKEALALLKDELAFQSRQDLTHLPAGVIHGDLFVDNILFEGNAVSGIIDFYYAHDAPYAMDLAIALNAQAVQLNEEDVDRMQALLDGYQQVRRLSESENEALPVLLRRAALRFWISRLYDAIHPREGAMTQIKDPEEYRRKLELHRHAGSWI